MAQCVARDRWHRAGPAIDDTVRGPRLMATNDYDYDYEHYDYDYYYYLSLIHI